MSGGILFILCCWLCFAFSHLWQQSLWADCSDALEAASSLGLEVHNRGLLPRWKMSGSWEGQSVDILWCGGLLRSYSVIRLDGRKMRFSLLMSSDELSEALGTFQT